MPTKQPPRVQFNYEPELTDVITEEINPNFVYDAEGTEDHDISMEIEDSMELPSIEKEDIVEHDIFHDPLFVVTLKFFHGNVSTDGNIVGTHRWSDVE